MIMVGAIRTADLCVGCHVVSRGALLASFTYRFRFRRDSPLPDLQTERVQNR
ncbi:MAG: hypothetical protein JWM11_4459 [Planctomycetaceae bacterium]|nr:hypothetical protein [Planctomycetaceae bacterium]